MEENKEKLPVPVETMTALDLHRDYGVGRTATVDSAEVHLRDYWRIIRRRLWVPISSVFVIVTLTTIYNLRAPSIYEGLTQIQIDRESSALELKDLSISYWGDDSQYLNTQVRNLKSPTLAYEVVKTLDLENNPKFIPKGGRKKGAEQKKLEETPDRQADMRRLENYTDALLESVEIERVRETRLVQIRYRHPDQELAKKVADTWADVFVQRNLEKRLKGNKDSLAFLESRIGELKLKLKSAEEQLINYRRQHQVIDFGEKENTVLARLAELNRRLLEAENERKTLQVTYNLSRQLPDPNALPEVQRDPLIQELNKKLTELKQQRAQLLVEFTPEWPAVRQIEQQIVQLEGELRASYQRILGGIETQYRSALQREEALRKAFNEQRSETLLQNEGAIQANILQQEVDTNRALLDKLLQSQKEVDVSAASKKNNISVTDYSPWPRRPVAPKRAQNIALSFLLALIGGVGLALFLDYINNKIESVEDIDRYLQLPALGVIPVFPEGKARKRLTRALASKELAPATVNTSVYSGPMILTEIDPNSSIAESYRQLRTAVLLSSADHAPRTILVTSSQPAEGKTTTSVNLAISLAQTGASVLILDADLHRPRVHKIFGIKNAQGLCNYLAGDCELASLVQIALPNLYILPVGPLPPNPAELLGSDKMRQMIKTLAGNFDHVVIDSPPVASFADSLILSSMVEGVILVVRGDFTLREVAQRTKANLLSVGARILGVVANHVKLQPHDYYYYSTYYSRYYYQDSDAADEQNIEPKNKAAKDA